MREDWIEVTIDDMISKRGIFKDGDWIESKDQDPKGDIRLIQLADIGDGIFLNKSDRYLTKTKAEELHCTYLKEGDLIIARMPHPLGRATIFPLNGSEKYVTVVDVAIVRFGSTNILSKFLMYSINSPKSRKEIEALQSGTTRKRISRKNLSTIKFPLAPLPEQRAIVAKIEALFCKLDNGISNLNKAKEKLEIYQEAVLKKAFEGELTKEWRESQINLPTAFELMEEIKNERIRCYEEQLKNWKMDLIKWEESGHKNSKPIKPKKSKELTGFTSDELMKYRELPKQWKWVKIDNIQGFNQNAIKAGPFGSALKKECYVETGYKIYGQEQVISGDWKIGNYYIDENKFSELMSCEVKPNDVLISLVGTVGKVLVLPNDIEPGIINPRLIKISLAEAFYLPDFFKYYFESSYLKSLYSTKSHGATMDIINLGIIQELPFPLLTIGEQKELVLQIEDRLSVCDSILKNIEEGLYKAKALKQSILKKAFEGKLLNQDELEACKREPDWEPAEKLLEKIKKDEVRS